MNRIQWQLKKEYELAVSDTESINGRGGRSSLESNSGQPVSEASTKRNWDTKTSANSPLGHTMVAPDTEVAMEG